MISANAHEKCGFEADLSPSLRMLHGKKTVPSTDPKEALLVLLEVTRELAERRPLEESLSVVTRAAVRLVRADHASVRLLDSTRTVLDVVAVPVETPLVLAARAAGIDVIDGGSVVTLQAIAQFELYTGVRPSTDQAAMAADHARH